MRHNDFCTSLTYWTPSNCRGTPWRATTKYAAALLSIASVLCLLALPLCAQTSAPAVQAAVQEKAARLALITKPLSFEPNVGQPVPGLERAAKFVARRADCTVQLDRHGALLDVAGSGALRRQVRMDFAGANASPGISGESKLPGIASYFPASDTRTWRTAIPTYGRVAYKDVYPGVDLAFYGNEGRLEFDVALNPGAATHDIALALSGADHVELDKAGNLVLSVDGRDLRLLKPAAYQQTASGTKKPVEVTYRVQKADTKGDSAVLVHLDVGGSYDRNQALVIDPVLDFSTLTDATNGLDYVSGVAVDGSGNIYVAGNNYNQYGINVLKYNSSGKTELFNAVFGSDVGTSVYGLAVDATGRAYVAGWAHPGLPTTSGAYQTTSPHPDTNVAFLTVLTADGSALAYSTYLGGSENDTVAYGLALDSSANAYLYGQTWASDFPTTEGAYLTTFPTSYSPWFVAKINPSKSGAKSLVYSTLFWPPGSNPGSTLATGIAADPSGNTYLTGYGNELTTTAGAYTYSGPNTNLDGIFVSKLNAAGSALTYSAYLGPGQAENPQCNANLIAVDTGGSAYVTGNVLADDYPTTSGAWQTSYPGAFVTNLSADGSTLLYSTFLNGPSSATNYTLTVPTAIAVTPGCSSACNAFVTGHTLASDFPMVNAIQTYTTAKGQDEAFAAELRGNGASAVYATYFGGTSGGLSFPTGYVPTISGDAAGNAYLAGNQSFTDFPATLAPSSTTGYGYLAKIGPASAGATVAVPLSVNFGTQAVGAGSSLFGNNQTVELRNMGSAPVSSLVITSSDSEFTESDNCAGRVAAGGICKMTLAFTPSQSGTRNAHLAIASNAVNSPFTVTMTGTGTDEAYITVTPASLSFPDQAVTTTSAARTLTFTNIGDQATTSFSYGGAPAGFIQVNNCPQILGVGASCTMSVQFSPSGIGLDTGTMNTSWGNSPNTPLSVPLTGTGTISGVTGAVTLSDTALNFGTETVGVTTGTQSVWLTNTGSVTVTLSALAATTTTSGGGAKDFSTTYSSCGVPPVQLNPQQVCQVNLQFTPSLASAEAGTLTFTDDASGSPQTVSLSGLGVSSSQVLEFEPGNQVFPPQPVGFPSAAQTFYVYDQGNSPVAIDRAEITGPFQVSYDGCSGHTLQPPPALGVQGSSCSISVVFLPTATGTATGTLTLIDAATGNPQALNLMGTGITATGGVVLSPTAIAFDPQMLGTTSGGQTVTITNPGNSAVTLNSYYTTTSEYAISHNSCGTAPWVLAAGSYCTVSVTFTPTSATNPRTGTLAVGSTSGNQTVMLTGTGETASMALGLTPTTMSFGNVQEGTTQTLWGWVRNTGTETVTFTSGTLTGPNSDFSGTTWCDGKAGFFGGTLAPGQSCAFSIAFAPASASGLETATFTLASSASNSPLTMSISGTSTSLAPAVQLVPHGVSFNQTLPGTVTTTAGYPSGNNTVTFYNNGAASITLTPTTISGGSANFALVSGQDNCSNSTVTAGSSCSVQVQFNPASAGYLTGTLTFTESTGTKFSAALAGYAPALVDSAVLDPTALNFPAQVVGTASCYYYHSWDTSCPSASLTNTGNTSLTVGTLTGVNTIVGTSTTGDFSVVGDGCSGSKVQPGSSCTVYVASAPVSSGARGGNITFPVTYQDSTTAGFTATLAGNGSAVQDGAVLSPTSLTFTGQPVGTTSCYYYYSWDTSCPSASLTNTGNTSLTGGTLTGVNTIVGTSTAGDFSVVGDGCSGSKVQPGSSCTVYVAFAPVSSGARSGSITFPVTYKDHTTANFTATLAGKGVAASTTVAVMPTALNFGKQVVGQGVDHQYTVTVTNTGNTPVTIGTSTNSSAQFPIVSDSCSRNTIQPGKSCSYSMGYAPTSTGTVSATLTIPDNAAGHPHTVGLAGAGIAATSQIVLSQTSLSFGKESVGVTSPSQVVYVTNQGNTFVTISSIMITGTNATDFSESDNCRTYVRYPYHSWGLVPNSSCQITLSFKPSAVGTRTATVIITDSATGSPHKISLTGTGLNSLPTVTLLSPSSPTRGGAAFTLTVTGTKYVSTSTVQWKGKGLKTTYVSDKKLTASVPAIDIAKAGTASVTVKNPTPGAGTSSALTFTIQ